MAQTVKYPFTENERVATPLTFYAASKPANEAMGHSYAHNYNLPITIFRFFTVYEPWGTPDIAYFRFVRSIIEGKPINIYNNGGMCHDFTYVEDLVRGTAGLIDAVRKGRRNPKRYAARTALAQRLPSAPWI